MKTMLLAASHDAFYSISPRGGVGTLVHQEIFTLDANEEDERSQQYRRRRRRPPIMSSSSSSKGTASFTSSAAADGDGGGKKGKSGAAFMTQTVSDYEAKQRAISASWAGYTIGNRTLVQYRSI